MFGKLYFSLYVIGTAPNSRRAISNLQSFCETASREQHEVEIVDLLVSPERALENKIVLTPTLSMRAGDTTYWIVGDLSDSATLSDIANQLSAKS